LFLCVDWKVKRVPKVILFRWMLVYAAPPVYIYFPVLTIYACLPMAQCVVTLAKYIAQFGRMRKTCSLHGDWATCTQFL
jgi:hypothetical protein